MDLSFVTDGDLLIVEVSGIVDHKDAAQLHAAIAGQVGTGQTSLIVDLSGVIRLSHAGVRALALAARLVRAAGGELRVCGASRTNQVRLRSLLFTSLMKSDPTRAASVAALDPTSCEEFAVDDQVDPDAAQTSDAGPDIPDARPEDNLVRLVPAKTRAAPPKIAPSKQAPTLRGHPGAPRRGSL